MEQELTKAVNKIAELCNNSKLTVDEREDINRAMSIIISNLDSKPKNDTPEEK